MSVTDSVKSGPLILSLNLGLIQHLLYWDDSGSRIYLSIGKGNLSFHYIRLLLIHIYVVVRKGDQSKRG